MTIVDTVRHARADLLDRTAQLIEASLPLDDHGFTDALRAARAAGVQASSIAKRHGMAVSTVTRWEKGVNHPHPVLRDKVAIQLAVLARRDAEKLRAACAPVAIAA